MIIKKYFILIIVCVFALMNSCSTSRTGLVMLNEEITKTQYRSFPGYLSMKKQWEKHFRKHGGAFCVECHLMEKFRLYRYSSGFFNEIKENDTIYIIESCSQPYNNYFLTIWNRTDTASFYAYPVERILHKKSEERIFSRCEMELIGKWDIKGIRYEEDNHSGMLGGGINYATRVIIKKNKYKIDCICYNEFYLYDREKYDAFPVENHPKNHPKCGED